MDGETGAVYQELLHLKAFLQDKKDMTALDEFTDMKKKSLAVRLEAELLTADQQTTEEFVIRTLEEFSLTIRKEHITETEAGFERIRQLFTEMAEKRKACAKKDQRGAGTGIYIYEGMLRGRTGNGAFCHRIDPEQSCGGLYPRVWL